MRLSKMLLAILLVLVSLSCTPSSTSDSERSKIPAGLKITVGTGGGFSGLWTGYSILASDSLIAWEGRSIGDSPRFVGRLTPDTLAQWWHTIQTQRFLDLPSRTVAANYVEFISVSVGDSAHMFMWEPRADQDTTAFLAKEFRTRCLSGIREVSGR